MPHCAAFVDYMRAAFTLSFVGLGSTEESLPLENVANLNLAPEQDGLPYQDVTEEIQCSCHPYTKRTVRHDATSHRSTP